MKKTEDKLLNNREARLLTSLLTGSYQDMSSLLTKLFTAANEMKASRKTIVARVRVDEAMKSIADGIKYGWSFGLSGHELRVKSLKPVHASRRVRFLTSQAIKAGLNIGDTQLARMRRHQPTKRLHGPATNINAAL